MPSRFDDYRDGRVLFGDGFSEAEIEAWYQDEKEGYFNMGQYFNPGEGHRIGSYGYHALNWHHAFSYLPAGISFERVLGIGSAFGDELKPVKDRAMRITILEPSDGFVHDKYEYVKPQPSGRIPFPDSAFDLVTCFGVLHHIPNVSFVVREIGRCMKPGAWFLLREPTESMGNWDHVRPGLTRRERGIPFSILLDIVRNAGLQIVHSRRCTFSITSRIQAMLTRHGGVYDRKWAVLLDDFVSNLPVWTKRYHPENLLQRFRPLSLYVVARKPVLPK